MTPAAVLRVQVAIDNFARTAAQIEALDRDLARAGRSADGMGGSAQQAARDVDRIGGSARSTGQQVQKMAGQVDVARKHVGGLGDDFKTLHKEKSRADSLIEKNIGTFGQLGAAVSNTASRVISLGGGFSKLWALITIGLPVVIALSGALFAVGAALAPLTGLAAAAAVGLSAFAQAAGTVGLAVIGVKDALKEQLEVGDKAAKQARTSADQQRSAANAIRSAQEGVRNAHEQVQSATEQLTRAEQDRTKALGALGAAETQATRDLVDMHAALTNAYLTETEATRSLDDARQRLADALKPADVLKVAEAESAVANASLNAQRATLNLADAQARLSTSTLNEQRAVIGLTDARQRLEDLMKPADALSVADAQDAVADATRDQTRAQLRLADAQLALNRLLGNPLADATALAKARLDVADAENAIGDATRGREHAERDLQKIQQGPTEQDLAKAKLDVADAEQQIADAARGTASAQLGVADANQAVTDAAINAAKAQKELNDTLTGPDLREVAQARLDIARAEQALTEATRTRRRLQKDVDAADKAGVENAPGVIAAKERIADAERQVVEAQRQLRDANRGVVKALQQVDDAQASAASSAAAAAEANRDLNKKFNDLPPSAQAFVKELVALKPKFDTLRETAARGLFPGVVDGIKSADGAFGAINRTTGRTARTLGNLASRAGELIGSKAFAKDIATIGHRNQIIIGRLGRAGIYLGDALRHILVAAGPLTTWLAKVTYQWAKNLDATTKTSRESGKLAKFFQKVRNTAILVTHALGQLGGGLFEIGKQSAPFGRDMLHNMDEAFTKFNKWTKTAEGKNSIAEFFRISRDFAEALFPVLGQILKAFGRYSKTVLPAFTEVLATIEPIVGPLVEAFLYWKFAMTVLAPAIAAVNAVLAITGAGLAPVLLVVGAIAALAAAAVIAYKKSDKFRNAVNGAWDDIKRTVEPIVEWFKTEVPKAFDKFSDLSIQAGEDLVDWVNEHKDDIKAFGEAWKNIGKGVLAAFNYVLDILKEIWPDIKKYISGQLDVLGGIIDIFSGVFTGDWRRVWDGVKGVFRGYMKELTAIVDALVRTLAKVITDLAPLVADAATALFNAWIDAWKASPGAIKDAAEWAVNAYIDATKAVAGWLFDAGKWIVETVFSGFKAQFNLVKEGAQWLSSKVKEAIDALVGQFKNRGFDVLSWITDGFKAYQNLVKGAGQWLSSTLKDGIDAITGQFKNRGEDVIKWISEALTTAPAKLLGFATWLRDTLKSVLEGLAGGFVNRGEAVLGWITDGLRPAVENLPARLLSWAGWLRDTLRTLLEGALDGFTGLGKTLMGWIIDGMKVGAYELQGFLNKIIKIVNKLPGVDIKPIDVLKKDPKTGEISGFARGGAYARTGGVVNKPIVMMGEEAPTFPEIVVPLNPAYRGRAQQLAMMAAHAVGLAKGGINVADYNHVYPAHYIEQPGVQFSPDVVEAIFNSVGLPGKTFDQIAHGESDRHPGVVQHDPGDGMVGYGLVQNTPNAWGRGSAAWNYMEQLGGITQLLNPVKGALMARFLYHAAGDKITPWYGTKYVTDTGGGPLGKLSDLAKSALHALNPLDLIGDLPNANDLPGWLKGLGKYALGKVGEYIKHALTSVIPGGGRDASDVHGLVPRVVKALAFARSHGWGGSVTSGYRSIAEQQYLWDHAEALGLVRGKTVAAPGSSSHQFGEAVDVTDIPGFARAMSMMPADQRLYSLVPGDPVHFSVTGHAKGGMWGGLPFAGSFDEGGIVPGPVGKPYAAVVHGGEQIGQPGEMRVRVVVEDHTTRVYVDDVEQTVERVIDKRDRRLRGNYRAGV